MQLFHAYCTVQDAKLAAKVAVIFKLTSADLTDWHQVQLSVQQMLQSQSSYKAAVHMMMQFEVRPLTSMLVGSGTACHCAAGVQLLQPCTLLQRPHV